MSLEALKELDTLEIFLSNRCNLACTYCSVQVNEGRAAYLDEAVLLKAVDYFFARSGAPRKAVNILGGEPLLQFPLLQRLARHARDKSPEAVIDVTTNGTLLTRERYDALAALDVRVTVSLDGLRTTNDGQRVFHGDRDGSVHAAVTERLRDLPVDRLGASLVFLSGNVDRLFQNVYYLARLGFGRINFQPEFYELWAPERLETFRRQLRLVADHYIDSFRGGRPFVIPMLLNVLNPARARSGWWKQCHSLVLGPEGQFLPCNRSMGLVQGGRRSAAVGSAAAGADWEGRRRSYEEAAGRLAEALGPEEAYDFCPMGMVFSGRLGEDPERGMRNFQAVSRVLSEGLMSIASRLRGTPEFDALYGTAA